MKFIFWQNIISIHQSAFLRSLAEQHEVVLIVEDTVSQDRIDQGWRIPNIGRVQIIQSPSADFVNHLLKVYQTDWHIFSGFNSIKTSYEALKKASASNLKIAIIAEPFRWLGFIGIIRYFKYLAFRIRYVNKIRFLLITGSKGLGWYHKVGFPNSKLYPWAYFTEKMPTTDQIRFNYLNSTKPNILFVGQINQRKNILELTKICKQNTPLYGVFNIIGAGLLEKKLKEMIEGESQIKFLGSVSNESVSQYMQNADLLILPSIFDGWGAVVNEALQVGSRVIASENCGASDLLDGAFRGEKFSFRGGNSLKVVLKRWLEKGKVNDYERQSIHTWTESHLSGKVAAEYFIQIIASIENKSSPRPSAPWLTN
jgi:glycosyltransferase involved in cell wall biosynthesis